MKNPTLRKLRNRGLTPIRYRMSEDAAHAGVRHGWIVSRGERGAMVVHLIGEERNRRLSRAEARHVTELS